MNLVKLIDFLRDRLRLVIWVSGGLLFSLCAYDVYRVYGPHGHAAAAAAHGAAPAEAAAGHAPAASHGFLQSLYHIAETQPVFWAAFGFIACVLIVFVSKAYGHMKVGNTEIMTREDYYNE